MNDDRSLVDQLPVVLSASPFYFIGRAVSFDGSVIGCQLIGVSANGGTLMTAMGRFAIFLYSS